ncbi:hypothetical protein FQ192_01835 [Pseudomonas sp. ANT_J12]|nr:hypothetical protein FQ192_01835 [Pseudomonas sp. ANT_J12]
MLAKAAAHPTLMLADTPLSRASFAPTGLCESRAKKSPISLMRSIGLQHSGATSAKGGSMRVKP